MKKIILKLFITAYFAGCVNANAQSFALSNYILQSTEPGSTQLIESYVNVQNLTNDTIYVHVERTVIYQVAGHDESFCFGAYCYPPSTVVSIDPTVIPPGGLDYTFRADVFPNNVCGTTSVHYRFYNQNISSDSVGIDLSFGFCTAAGLDDLSATSFVSSPTKNPADVSTSFNYLLKESNKNARLVIYNMLGAKILSIPVYQQKGEMHINTSDLKSGVYLCSLVNGEKIINTSKLVVSHK